MSRSVAVMEKTGMCECQKMNESSNLNTFSLYACCFMNFLLGQLKDFHQYVIYSAANNLPGN